MDATAVPETFRVRRAAAADVALLAELGARTFVDAFSADNDPQDLERYVADAFSHERIATELAQDGSVFLVAHDDAYASAPVGYCRLQRGATDDSVDARTPIELVRIYIEPATTGRGYGSALLQACLDEAARGGHDVIWLGVWEHNLRARRFYERWGFRHVGDHTFMLGRQRQRDHVMARPVR